METYEELRAKMIEAFGYERTEEIKQMALKEVKRMKEESKCMTTNGYQMKNSMPPKQR